MISLVSTCVPPSAPPAPNQPALIGALSTMAAPAGGTHHQDPANEPAAEVPAPVGKFRAAPDGFNYRAPYADSFTMTSSANHGAPRTSLAYSDIAYFCPSEVPLSPPTKETQLLLQHTHQPPSPSEFHNGYFMGRRPNGQGSFGLVFHPASGHRNSDHLSPHGLMGLGSRVLSPLDFGCRPYPTRGPSLVARRPA